MKGEQRHKFLQKQLKNAVLNVDFSQVRLSKVRREPSELKLRYQVRLSKVRRDRTELCKNAFFKTYVHTQQPFIYARLPQQLKADFHEECGFRTMFTVVLWKHHVNLLLRTGNLRRVSKKRNLR